MRLRLRPISLTVPVLGLLASGGCGDLLGQPYPAKSYFSLDPGKPAPVTAADPTGPGPVLLVRAVRVSPPSDGLAFVYQTGPDRYAADYYVNWIATPSALLTGGMTGWLAAATPLSVVADGSSARPDLVLDAEVTRLVIDRTDPTRPRAVLAARCFLSREDPSAAGSTVFDRSYAAEVVAGSDTPAAYAAAWDQAYRQVLERLAADIRSAALRPG